MNTSAAVQDHVPASRAAGAALEGYRDVLAAPDRDHLDQAGFVVIPGVIDPDWRRSLCARLEALCAEEGPGGFHENKTQGIGTGLLADLVNKGEVFDGTWKHPLVLSAALHAIGSSTRLLCLNYRDPQPGDGQQGLHRDTGGARTKLQCIWCLDDFTADNGATRVVAGSHHQPYAFENLPLDASGQHPQEMLLCASAGSLIVYHGNLLHSGTRNRSDGSRRSLILSYIPRDYPQLCNQAEYLRVSTAGRLSLFDRWLLDA
jgi:hypothetical protein